MNKYQKKLNKETKLALKDGVFINGINFQEARNSLKFMAKTSCFSPCEDCDNPRCKKQINPLWYCPERR